MRTLEGQTPEPVALPLYSHVLITVYLCLLNIIFQFPITAYFKRCVLLSKTQTIVNISNDIFATKKLQEQSKSLVYNFGKNNGKRKPCYKH